MRWAGPETDYSTIVTAFQIAYAVGLVTTGRLLDFIGTARGYAGALSLWSIAGMAHALASSVFGFASARFALGIAESANFPAAIKTVSEWFPKKERAFAPACLPNIFTVMTDVFPQRALGSIVGLAGMAGSIGGALISIIVGLILDVTGSYIPTFAMFSFAYLTAWLVLKIGIPRVEPVRL